MEKIALLLTTVLVSIKFSEGAFLRPGDQVPIVRQDTRCADGWTAFKDEKCILIVSRSGLQTQEDAEMVCGAYANDSSNIPKLLTVKSYEEQAFLHNFLFVKNKVLDHVWLGLKENWKGVFEWNDGSEIYFTNWEKQNISDDQHKCVQMESGAGNDPPGVWVKVNCDKRNAVVCEKMQNWSPHGLQTTIVNLKLQLQHTEKEFKTFKESAEAEIHNLETRSANGLPIGSIYVQLGGQAAPTALWPSTTWKDVSSSYAGLFFRVVGGTADQFGVTQTESCPLLQNVESQQNGANSSSTLTTISSNTSWSSYIYTGTSYSGTTMGIRFQVTDDEVRPANQAVIIWLRIL